MKSRKLKSLTKIIILPMNHNFSTPTRQSPVGIIVLILKMIFNIIRALGIFLILFILRKYEIILEYPLYFFWGFLGMFVLIVGWGILLYRNYFFYIDETSEEFILKKGVLNKQQSIVHFKNIEQVNLSQGIIAQALDFYQLEIETAASDKPEIVIYALDEPKALALKNKLMVLAGKKDNAHDVTINIAEPTNEIITISHKNLFVASLFSNYLRGLLLSIGFIIAFWNQLDDIFLVNEYKEDVVHYVSEQREQIFYIVLLILLFVPFVINVFRYAIKYFRYKIDYTRSSEYHLEYGLTNLQNRIVKTGKIQQIDIQENYILKKLGVVFLWLRQISAMENNKEESVLHIPGLTHTESQAVIQHWQSDIKDIKDTASMHKPHKRKMWVQFFVRMVIMLAFLAVMIWLSEDLPHVIIAISSLVSVLVVIVPFIAYQNEFLWISDEYIIHKSGFWEVKEAIVPIYKIQSVTSSQKLWHKKHGLSSVSLINASATVYLDVYDKDVLQQIVNYTLYKVEAENKNWMQ